MATKGLGNNTPKQSGKSPKSLLKVSKESFGTLHKTLWRLFGVPGPEAPGDISKTFSAFQARRARETSVKGGLVRNNRGGVAAIVCDSTGSKVPQGYCFTCLATRGMFRLGSNSTVP